MAELNIPPHVLVIVVTFFIIYLVFNHKHKKDSEQKNSEDSFWIEEGFLKEKKELVSKLLEFEKKIQELNFDINKKAYERLDLEKTLKELNIKLNRLNTENISLRQQISDASTTAQHKIALFQKAVLELETENDILRDEISNLKSNHTQASKECPACKRKQPLSEFKKNQNQPDGLTKWCIRCIVDGAPMPNDTSGTKICEKCKQNRRKTSFYPTTKYPDGLSKWCKFCLDRH